MPRGPTPTAHSPLASFAPHGAPPPCARLVSLRSLAGPQALRSRLVTGASLFPEATLPLSLSCLSPPASYLLLTSVSASAAPADADPASARACSRTSAHRPFEQATSRRHCHPRARRRRRSGLCPAAR